MARTNGIESLSLKELTELHAKVQEAINTRRKTDLVETKAKMAQLAAEAGFSLEELIGKADGRKGPRSVVPVKFRNPDNPDETWTGPWPATPLARRQARQARRDHRGLPHLTSVRLPTSHEGRCGPGAPPERA